MLVFEGCGGSDYKSPAVVRYFIHTPSKYNLLSIRASDQQDLFMGVPKSQRRKERHHLPSTGPGTPVILLVLH